MEGENTDFNFDEMPEDLRSLCEEYVIDLSLAKAVRRSGFRENPKAALYHLKKPEAQAFIKHLQKNAAKTAGVTLIRNAKELAKVAYGSVANLRENWTTLRDWEDLTDDEKGILSEIQVTTKSYDVNKETVFEETVRFKTHDKLKAIDSLNKLFGFNAAEKVEVTGEDGGPIKITGMVIKKA